MLLAAGHRLTARDLALAAAMNYPHIPVHRRARVAVLATGDELVMPGVTPAGGQIVYSNGFALTAQVRNEGAEVIDLGIAPDRLDDTVAAVRRAREANADVLVTTGGASVGDHDLVQQAFKSVGMAMTFWKIAMRPGRCTGADVAAKACPDLMKCGMDVLGLPGNPVSAFVCGVLFLVPLLRRARRPPRSRARHRLGDLSVATSARTTNAPIICAPRSQRERRRNPGRNAFSGAGQFHARAAGERRMSCHSRALRAARKIGNSLRYRKARVLTIAQTRAFAN